MANLPLDLIASLAKRVDSLEDYTSFGAVCRSWRLAATKENFTRVQQVPWLMLPEREGSTIREFYHMKKNKIYKRHLPETKDKFCCSSLGWLMTQSDKNSEVNLLHPFSHKQTIELPNLKAFKDAHPVPAGSESDEWAYSFGSFFVRRFVLSSSPSFAPDYTVLIHSWERLAFWRPGDNNWTIAESPQDSKLGVFFDITYFKGQFYVVEGCGRVSICEFTHPNPNKAKMRAVVPSWPKELDIDGEQIHFVESDGVLLVIVRFSEETTRFRLFQVPLTDGKWFTATEVKNLGKTSVFVGYNSSLCVDAFDYNGCKPNCVYFTDYLPTYFNSRRVEEVSVFHLEDGKTEPVSNEFHRLLTPYLWIEPIF